MTRPEDWALGVYVVFHFALYVGAMFAAYALWSLPR